MEPYIKDQIKAVLRYVPFHMIAGCLRKQTSPAVDEARRKIGGFMKGICHPSENYEQIKGAGIEWNRADIPFPFDAQGAVRQEYLDWKEKMRHYQANGIRIMAVTPYPRTYSEFGVDPVQNEERVREIAVFLLEDLKGIAEVFQITNEMGIPRFTQPLTLKQAARFIGVHLEAMYPHRGDILLGYNSAGPQGDLHALMRPWLKYCDYVGIDVYVGCFAPIGNHLIFNDLTLRYIWSMTRKPILLAEFGYISGGAPKTPEEKRAILRQYGVSSEKEAKEKIDLVLENMKTVAPTLQARVTKNASGDSPKSRADYLFQIDTKNHLYRELPKHVVVKNCPHTPEGQADFYRAVLPRLAAQPFLLGAFIYAWKDGERCYACGQSDCPTETRWGLVDTQHKEKPSYYAVRDALKEI